MYRKVLLVSPCTFVDIIIPDTVVDEQRASNKNLVEISFELGGGRRGANFSPVLKRAVLLL